MPYDRAGYRDHCGECRHYEKANGIDNEPNPKEN